MSFILAQRVAAKIPIELIITPSTPPIPIALAYPFQSPPYKDVYIALVPAPINADPTISPIPGTKNITNPVVVNPIPVISCR